MESSVLFGNGINNLSENRIPWNILLDKIKGPKKFDNGSLPNTFIYERALFENRELKNIRDTEFKIKLAIAELLSSIETNDYYKMLFDLDCKNYMTTNYDNAFLNCILNIGNYSDENRSTEGVYSIRRKTLIKDHLQNDVCNIWNIHGEISKPVSIMLGLDHYCGSVSKLDAYVKGTYEFREKSRPIRVKRMSEKLKRNQFDGRSWAELFFTNHIHIVGLSLDFSETDLWWILTKRARLLNDSKIKDLINNSIYFYSKDIRKDKEELLKSLGVKVIKPAKKQANYSWNDYYTDTFDMIKREII